MKKDLSNLTKVNKISLAVWKTSSNEKDFHFLDGQQNWVKSIGLEMKDKFEGSILHINHW